MRIGEGTVVLVTGGASGLGESVVRKMHTLGCSVCVADMNKDTMDLITKELGPERVLTVECNVTKEADVETAV